VPGCPDLLAGLSTHAQPQPAPFLWARPAPVPLPCPVPGPGDPGACRCSWCPCPPSTRHPGNPCPCDGCHPVDPDQDPTSGAAPVPPASPLGGPQLVITTCAAFFMHFRGGPAPDYRRVTGEIRHQSPGLGDFASSGEGLVAVFGSAEVKGCTRSRSWSGPLCGRCHSGSSPELQNWPTK
jgi:hypothetical protein